MKLDLLRYALRNAFGHKLRAYLTVLGIAVALLAFCIIRTMLDAWHIGVKASAKDRLVTRNAVSLVVSLPVSYRQKIAGVSGIEKVGYANWFGGIYKDEHNRFAQFAIDDDYIDVYPELVLDATQRSDFIKDRQGVLIGAQLAEKYGFKLGDRIQIKGTIYPGLWDFVVRGIFTSKKNAGTTKIMFFHWDYLNERNKTTLSRQPDKVGIYVTRVAPGADPAAVAKSIDALFANSYAETLTETETAFQQGFLSMSSTILTAMNVISLSVIVIILLVLANTMVMSARERYREFAILKCLGFRPRDLTVVIFGESITLAFGGFVLLCILLVPVFNFFAGFILANLGDFFPVFDFNFINLLYAFLIAMLVGSLSGILPYIAVSRTKVSEGLREVS